MQRDAVALSSEQTGQAAGGGGGDELRVIDAEASRAQDLAAHTPVEAADSPTRGAEFLALEIGRGLHIGGHHIGLRQPGRQAPELLHLHAAADRHVVHAHNGRSLRRRRARRGGRAALELDDGRLDATLREEAELLGHIGGRVHHIGRRDRDADVDLSHRAAGLCRRFADSRVSERDAEHRRRQYPDQSIPVCHRTFPSSSPGPPRI